MPGPSEPKVPSGAGGGEGRGGDAATAARATNGDPPADNRPRAPPPERVKRAGSGGVAEPSGVNGVRHDAVGGAAPGEGVKTTTSASDFVGKDDGAPGGGKRLDKYEMGPLISKTKFSHVFKARVRATRELVALKKIEIFEIMEPAKRQKILKEADLIRSLDHPNIVRCVEHFIEDNVFVLVFEWAARGDIKRLIRKAISAGTVVAEKDLWRYAMEVADAVRHMHERRVLHRDLKPANIFVAQDGRLKVGDLGLGREFSSNTVEAFSKVGTPLYMSPEVIQGSGYDWKSDVWSLGCVLYELATLRSPFRSEGATNIYGIFKNIKNCDYVPIDASRSLTLRDLVHSMLQLNPELRPSVAEVHTRAAAIVNSARSVPDDLPDPDADADRALDEALGLVPEKGGGEGAGKTQQQQQQQQQQRGDARKGKEDRVDDAGGKNDRNGENDRNKTGDGAGGVAQGAPRPPSPTAALAGDGRRPSAGIRGEGQHESPGGDDADTTPRRSRRGSARSSRAGSARSSRAGSARSSRAGSAKSSRAGSAKSSRAGSAKSSRAGSARGSGTRRDGNATPASAPGVPAVIVMETALEKLRLLDYEVRYVADAGRGPFSPVHFALGRDGHAAIADNGGALFGGDAGVDIEHLADLCSVSAWLLGECGVDRVPHELDPSRPDWSDEDPRVIATTLAATVRDAGVTLGFPSSSLLRPGAAACVALNGLLNAALRRCGFAFACPDFTGVARGSGDGDGDESAKPDVGAGAGNSDSDGNDPVVDDDVAVADEGAAYVFPEDLAEAREMGILPSLDDDPRAGAASKAPATWPAPVAEPSIAVDPEAWAAEAAAAAPHLRAAGAGSGTGSGTGPGSGAEPPTWRDRSAALSKRLAAIEVAGGARDAIEGLRDLAAEVAEDREKLAASERAWAARLSGGGDGAALAADVDTWRSARARLDTAQDRAERARAAVAAAEDELATIDASAAEARDALDDQVTRGTGAGRDGPVAKIRAAIASLRTEIQEMDVRVAILQNATWRIRSGTHTFGPAPSAHPLRY